jgi:ABC-type uncharacterized transport system auxiliary subunit
MMLNRFAMTRTQRRLIGAGLALVLASCASGPAPLDHYYRIDAGVPDAPVANRLEGVLQVDRFRADALTGERQVLFRASESAVEIRQHPYHRWSDPPAILLQAELISFLSVARAADSVFAATARVEPDYVVTGRIIEFERVLDPGIRVVVEIQLAATSADGKDILVNRTFREEREADNSSVESSVVAFSEAVHVIFEQFLTDLGGS